jgi:hypothetical protein
MIDWFNFGTMVLLYFWLLLTSPESRHRQLFVVVGAVLLTLGLVLRVWIRAGHG